MNSLTIAIALVLGSFSLFIGIHHVIYNHKLKTVSATDANHQATTPINRLFTLVVTIAVLFTVTLSIYRVTGRFDDWNQGQLDEHTDYLLAANITKGRQQLDKAPDDEIALLNLAQSYAAGGLYQDAIDTLDKLLLLQGNDAELLGMKANAMYYRNNRVISDNTRRVIEQALALNREELQTRLLLATDAYLKGEYQHAIEHWSILLDNQTQYFNRETINNAILRAQNKLNIE